jgi:hypothetical protein
MYIYASIYECVEPLTRRRTGLGVFVKYIGIYLRNLSHEFICKYRVVCIFLYISICIHAFKVMYPYMYVHLCMYMYVFVFMNNHIFIHIYIHTCIYLYVYLHTCKYILNRLAKLSFKVDDFGKVKTHIDFWEDILLESSYTVGYFIVGLFCYIYSFLLFMWLFSFIYALLAVLRITCRG